MNSTLKKILYSSVLVFFTLLTIRPMLNTLTNANDEYLRYVLMAFNIGILFSVLILNVVLFYIFHERKYFYHSLFIYSLFNYIAISSGLMNYTFKTDFYYLLGFWSYLIYLTVTLFIYVLLDIYIESRWMKKIFLLLSVVAIIGSIAALKYPYDIRIRMFIYYYGITVAITMMLVGFYKVKRSFKISKYYFIALYLLGGSAVILALNKIGILYSVLIIENLVFASAAIEAILFTIGIADQLIEVKKKNNDLIVLSTTDQLTGLKNRHYFDIIYSRLENESDRYSKPLTIILFDIDHFKIINDQFGHDVGDQILIKASKILSKTCRKLDISIRWGGEEFLVLLPETDLSGGVLVAEKLRKAIQTGLYSNEYKVTCSFGVAQRRQDESFDQLYRRTDIVLYRAKQEGRNKVVADYAELKSNFTEVNLTLRWYEGYECGNLLIDEQHRIIMEKTRSLIMKLANSSNSSIDSELDDLVGYIENHFEVEEQILETIAYPKLEEHKLIHKNILKETKNLVNEFLDGKVNTQKLYTFLYGEVIMGHLIGDDFGYFENMSHFLSKLV